jgi:hypothetical protein
LQNIGWTESRDTVLSERETERERQREPQPETEPSRHPRPQLSQPERGPSERETEREGQTEPQQETEPLKAQLASTVATDQLSRGASQRA